MRRSVFVTLLLSYITILLLFVLIGSIIFVRMTSALVENAEIANSTHLEQVKQDIDNKLKEIWHLEEQVATNPDFQNKLQESLSAREYPELKFYQLSKVMSQILSSNKLSDSFYIYLVDQNKVISPTMASDAQVFFDKLMPLGAMTYDQIKSLYFTGFRPNMYFSAQSVGNNTTKMIMSVQSLPLGVKTEIPAYVFLPIGSHLFADVVGKWGELNQGQFFIIDEDGELLSGNDNETGLLEQLKKNSMQQSGNYSFTYNSEEMMLSYTSSEQRGWKYVSVMPEQLILAKVHQIRSWSLRIVFLSLVVGIMICYYLAYRNFSPIRDVLQVIRRSGKITGSGKGSNEFAIIESTIHDLFVSEEHLKGKVSEQLPIIRSNFLARLIKGNVDAGTLTPESLSQMGIQFSSDYFAVMVIEIDDCSQFIKQDTESEWTLIKSVILNILAEIFMNTGYVIEQDRTRLLALINVDSDHPSSLERITKQISVMKEMMLDRFKTELTIAIGNIHHGMNEVGQCYSEACMAMDYKIIKGYNQTLVYEVVKDSSEGFYHYPLETELQLLNYAKAGDFKHIEILLDHMFASNRHMSSPEIGRCFYMDMLSTLMKIWNSMESKNQALMELQVDIIKAIPTILTMDDIHKKMKSYYQIICNHINESRTPHSERLYRGMMEYIHENYYKSELCLEMIAEHFHLSAKYVSAFFKTHSQKNMAETIAEIRMHHAKKMLMDQQLMVSNIAQAVGYTNDASFIRVFKKLEGVTPGKFRQSQASPSE